MTLQQDFDPGRRWWVLVTVMVGTMASIMSSTIINVAIPDMSQAFSLGQERAQWMATGFMAAMTISMLATAWLLARFGYRRTYMAAVLMLLAGGVGGGLGQHYGWVMAMRAVEGLAAGLIQPIPAIVILRAFRKEEQGRAMGIFGLGVVLAPAVGPTIGGYLVEHFGWRSIFFVVVPFCVAGLVMARRFLPLTGTESPDAPARRHRFPWLSLALLAVFVLALLNGLIALHDAMPGTHASASLAGTALIGVALAAAALFVILQVKLARPLLDPRLFRSRVFALGSVVSFVYGMALFGSTYLLPLMMQMPLALPPSTAGTVLLPAGLALAASIPVASRLIGRVPTRWLSTFGLCALAASRCWPSTAALRSGASRPLRSSVASASASSCRR